MGNYYYLFAYLLQKLIEIFLLQARDSYDYEKSELLLYQSAILEESNDLVAAKKFLQEHEKDIYDKYTYYESICRLHLKLEEFESAESGYRRLIRMNQENAAYYEGLAKALRINENTKAKLRMYEDMSAQYPRAYLPKRLPLDCAEGDDFLKHLRPYLCAALDKGTPSLFTDLKPLYETPQKVAVIEKLVESFVNCLKEKGRFSNGKDFSF